MTPAALIAGIRAMEQEIARLRAHVAAITPAPATTTEPGLDLTPILHRWGPGPLWEVCTEDGNVDGYVRALCYEDARQAAADMGCDGDYTVAECHEAPHAERLEHAVNDIVALLTEVTRLRLLASTPSPAPADNSGADLARGEGAFAGRRALPSAEATAYPVWIIVSGKLHDRYHAGVWFSREAAEEHLVAKRHRYPRGAVVYCHTGHMSADYRHLCETGTLPPKSGEVSNG